MSAPPTIEFGGTDEELDRYLGEFARRTGGLAGRDRKRGGWSLLLGHLLSTNPNCMPGRVRITREDGGRIAFRPSAIAFPWTRQKVARVLAARVGQLADYLKGRARGGAPEKFDPARLREPFASYGSDVASVTASFAWVVLAGLAALAAALVAATVASLPLMGLTVREIADRARAIEGAGGLPLPGPAELGSLGLGFKLGCAFIFGFPIAFFGGVFHSVALALGEAWERAARVPQASFALLVLGGTAALFPFTPVLALPCALLVPAAAHLGYTLVWGMRGERVREGRRPRMGVVLAALAAAIVVGRFLVPGVAVDKEFRDRLALFRDRFLLGHPPGRAFATAYYRFTLYAADPLKRFFSTSEKEAQRTLRIAAGTHPAAAAALRALRFTVAERPSAFDCAFDERGVFRDGRFVAVKDWGDPKEVGAALDALAEDAFRGGILGEVYGIAWHSMYYAGPPAGLLVFAGSCCPGVSILFRAMSRKGALVTLLVCLLTTAGLVAYGESRESAAADAVAALRREPTASRIASGLGHPSVAVRHEAAYRAFELKEGHAALADPLLKAAGDDDLRVRLWAVAALGKTRDPRAFDAIAGRLKDRELFVRYRAAEGLGHLGDRRAIAPLVRLLREGIWYEGLYALEALRRIAPEEY